MKNFGFYPQTDIRFGKDSVLEIAKILSPLGKNVLLVYGGGSIKKIGLYDRIKALLKDFNITELSGIEPNPRIESVREGAKLCKENKIDVVLAVGGGSVIDASKAIAGGALTDTDPWDLILRKAKLEAALPVVAVLTLAATGSEMNGNAVISNLSTNQKLAIASPLLLPKASICDPSYMFSLPSIQTAAGTADIMSHVFEQYFTAYNDAYLTDRISESVLKTCIKYCPIALENPEDYNARANLMWAGTIGLNGICALGKGGKAWSCHPIEHELSAFYDITHGVGLAIITPRWMRYILSENTVDKFCAFAQNVWNISGIEDKFQLANAGIDAVEDFFRSCGIPMSLNEVGIETDKLDIMAENAIANSMLEAAYVPLNKEDVKAILTTSLK